MKRAWVVVAAMLLVAGCASGPGQGTDPQSPTAAEPPVVSPSGSPSPTPEPPRPSPSPSPSPAASPSESPFIGREVSINVSGDLLWHNTLWFAAEIDARATGRGAMDFEPQLASLREFVSAADIGVCHSEVPFAEDGGPYSGYPLFGAPPAIAPAIAANGWDICTLASNHTMDQRWEGLVRTIDAHEAAGIVTVGTSRTEEEANSPVIITTEGGVDVGFVSQTYGLNGLPKAKGKPWSVTLLDAGTAIRDAKRARLAGADIVVVHMHAGDEYSHTPSAEQVAFAEEVTASKYVDFVFGQHAHVVQPVDVVNGKWVVYGTGNLIAQSGPAQPQTYDGFMAEVTFTETAPGTFEASRLEWAPTLITKHSRANPARVYLIPDEIDQRSGLASAMEQSAARTRRVVTSLHPEGLTERGQER